MLGTFIAPAAQVEWEAEINQEYTEKITVPFAGKK